MPAITLTIKGYTFQLLAPYEAGQPLGLAEASILNREWTAAVRTSFAAQMEIAIARAGGQLNHQEIAALQIDFQHHADEFAFKALSQSRTSDPLTRTKHDIAKRVLAIQLNTRGETKEQFGASRYELAVARLMNNPAIISQAEAQIAMTREAADTLAGMEPTDA